MIAQRYKDMLSGKSVIRQISEWSTARGTEIGYENVFDYSLGNPSVPCPEHFTKTCIDLLQTKEPVTLHGYSPTLTIPAVRKAVAESLNRRFGMDYGMEHIFMATGAAGALAHAMRCVAVPGQDIITFAPFFPEYKPYVEGAGLNLKVVPPRTKDFQIDFDAFDAMLDENTAAVLINTPNNPSGAAYSAETLTGLADRLRAASAKYGHRIFLISDEPYREIMFGGQPIQYAAKFYDDTLTCYSFSKSLSQHLRDTTAPYPGIPEMLAKLKANGVQLAVFSNKADALAKEVVKDYFGTQYFTIVRGQMTGVAPKPAAEGTNALLQALHADPASTLYVGDSNVDVETAHNANLPCCGAVWGFRTREELNAAGAEYLAENSDELYDVIMK